MKKKIVAIIMAVSVVATLVGCGEKKINPADYVVLPDYKSFELDAEVAAPYTDEQIDRYMQEELDYYIETYGLGETEPITDRTDVQEGDTANINYSGFLDGVAFEGGTAEEQNLKIGSGGFIEGFEAGLIGKNVGDEVELPLTFPEVYDNNPDLAGKDVIFKVKINSIAKDIPVPHDSALLEKLQLEVTTMEEYEADLRAYVDSQNEALTLNNKATAIWTAILDQAVVEKVPQQLIDAQKEKVNKQLAIMAKSMNMTEGEYIEASGSTREEFDQEVASYSEQVAKNLLVIEAIAQQEGIEVTDAEIKEASEEEAAASGYEDVSQYIENNYMDENNYRISKLQEKVTMYLIDCIKINETEVVNTNVFPW